MVAALEVYNKPLFSHREESFSILAVNAWELLLKARLLQINNNRLAAIIEYEKRRRADGKPTQVRYRKKNRSGNCITIGLFKAFDRLVENGEPIAKAIRLNLEALVEVRDNSVHFLNDDFGVAKSIHEIGAAAVKNYVAAVRIWFGLDLSRYSFALMPIAFLSAPRTVEGVTLNHEERQLLTYLGQLRESATDALEEDFNVALTIEVSVKRTKDTSGVPIVYSAQDSALPVRVEEEDIRERYPLSYEILTTRLQKRYTNFKANAKYHGLRKTLEGDSRFCRERLLDPANPKGLSKKFYSSAIVKEFDPHYERAKTDASEPAEKSVPARAPMT
jgi:hypothetical protein